MAELVCICCSGKYRYHVSSAGRRYIIEQRHGKTDIRYLTAYENQGRRMRKPWWRR